MQTAMLWFVAAGALLSFSVLVLIGLVVFLMVKTSQIQKRLDTRCNAIEGFIAGHEHDIAEFTKFIATEHEGPKRPPTEADVAGSWTRQKIRASMGNGSIPVKTETT